MTREEKRFYWKLYPEVWELFVEFNGITQDDGEAWDHLVGRAAKIHESHMSGTVDKILRETVRELDRISKRRK